MIQANLKKRETDGNVISQQHIGELLDYIEHKYKQLIRCTCWDSLLYISCFQTSSVHPLLIYGICEATYLT